MKALIILIALFLASCSSSTKLSTRLSNTKSWGYQLQNYDLQQLLKDSKEERLWVLDPDFDGKNVDSSFVAEIDKLGSLPIAYLSIGEAEVYRDYFKELDSSVLVKENPRWKGNFKVRFWKKSWQAIILKKIDRIIELGFKGVYLDIVDAFYYFKDKKLRADQMVYFIDAIKKRALSQSKEFIIIQQNAPTLYQYTEHSHLLFASVDALALEDVFFFGENEHDNSFKPQGYVLKAAKEYQDRGKSLFNVEYLKSPKLIQKYRESLKSHSFIPLVAPRALSGKQVYAEKLK